MLPSCAGETELFSLLGDGGVSLRTAEAYSGRFGTY